MGPRSALIAAVVLACPLLAAGCGGDDADEAQKPPPVARVEQFPKANGKTLAELREGLGEGGPVLAPAVSQFESGRRNRLAFGLFDRSRAQIADASVALYLAPVDGGAARGPYLARWESLAVDGPFQSEGVEADPDAAKSVYVAEVPFQRPGSYELLGIARLDERLVVASLAGTPLSVVEEDPVPDVGDPAPRTHTPTEADAGGDIASIDTRLPPSTMHGSDFADVVGKRPAVLIFATPALCQSRVCGPVVDIAEQVKAGHDGDAEFIHMEIYRDNTVENGFRPQVLEWRLPTEPWVFAVDRRGRVAARLEGAFSAGELEDAVAKATRG